MFKKLLSKKLLLSSILITPVALFVACGSGESNFRNVNLQYDGVTQPAWMQDLNWETKTFTLNLSLTEFAELTKIDSIVPISKLPYQIKATAPGDDTAKDHLFLIEKVIFSSQLEEISNNAFLGHSGFSEIKELVFPTDSKLRIIGDYAFAENKITTLTLPNSVNVIGKGAFKNNLITSLVYIPTTTAINDGAFWGNKLAADTLVASDKIQLGKGVFDQDPTKK